VLQADRHAPRSGVLSPRQSASDASPWLGMRRRLIEFPPTLLPFAVGFLAPNVCAGTIRLRRFQPDMDQVALHGHDGQGYGIPDVKDITGRKIVDHWKTSLQLLQRVPPAGILATLCECDAGEDGGGPRAVTAWQGFS
jgi:hypothetical protein